jgi:hypothetical protein
MEKSNRDDEKFVSSEEENSEEEGFLRPTYG